MWTVPHHSRLGGIVGLHYFSQLSWPVSLFVFYQFPDHLHYGLLPSLQQPICLWMVQCHPQFLHAEEHTHFVNDAAHEVSTPISQESGQYPKDWDVNLIQEFSNILAVWSGVAYAITCFVKWSWNTRILATLGSWFRSMVISMLVKSKCKWSNGTVATIRCRGALGKLPSCSKHCMQDLIDCCIWLVIPSHQKCSCNNDKVWSWLCWPTSLWHQFRVATQWALGTMNSSRFLVLPLGVEHKYKVSW